MVRNKETASRGEETEAAKEVGEEGAAAPGLAEGVEQEREDLLERKDEECRQLQDRLLRLAAEVENTRKRLEREKSDGICFANESLIRDLLPVVDNLERAIQHGEQEADFQSLLDGVRLTLKAFKDAFSKFGCVPFESLDKVFDPNYHEAVMQLESEEHPEKTVIQELQKGYTLRDRVIRPSMVVVSKAKT